MITFNFTGKTIVVTGGASGIGKSVVEVLVSSGARVIVLDRAELKSGPWESLVCDIRDDTSVSAVFAQIESDHESLDGLVQCAGVTDDSVFWKMTEDAWDHVLDVNLKGAFLVMKHAMPLLRRARDGAVVNLSSINGLRGKRGQANYSASKAGLIGLSKSAAKEAGYFGIRVNVVAPGLVLTPMVNELPDEVKKQSIDESALNRASEPEDIAHVVLFLLSDSARQITGEVIQVDGGQYI